jgi:Flp pilus assembly protein TadG
MQPANPLYKSAVRRAFYRDERGTVAIIFALSIVVLMLTCGLAIDVGRAVHANAKLRAAIDAAALAAAKGLRLQGLTVSQATALANTMLMENFVGGSKGLADIKGVNVIIDQAKSQVEVQVDAEVKTTLGQLAGITAFQIPKTGVAVFEAKDIEVAVQLDVTGSMSGSKIADLKDATKTLVDILIPATTSTGPSVRVGLAPFAAGVNAGPYANTIADGVTAAGGCVYERKDIAYQDTDNYPVGLLALKTKSDIGASGNCPGAQILPMTDDKALLKSSVDGFTTGGSTAGHLGTAFSWYLLAPTWSGIWPASAKPAAYKDGKTIKVAILMTDGEYNTLGSSNGGSNAAKSAQLAVDTCTAMKAKGIVVYTVGFKLNQSSAIATMNSCASSAGHAYLASDGASLKQAFKNIAENITQLRLSR